MSESGERINDGQAAFYFLSVLLHVFAKQSRASGFKRRSNNQAVPIMGVPKPLLRHPVGHAE